MHYIWRTRKKTQEELYEGAIRSDFSSTKKYLFAICLEDYCFTINYKQ